MTAAYKYTLPITRFWLIKRIHRISAVILTTFIAGHIANHLVAIAGIETHMRVMEQLRLVYRSVWFEPILLGCVLIQIVTGARLIFMARKSGKGFNGNRWRLLQRISGAYLLFFLLVHTSAIFSIRHWFELDSNFFAASAVLVIAPLTWLYAPYYWFGVFSIFVHMGCTLRALPVVAPRVKSLVAAITIAVGALVATIIVLVFGGALYPIDLPNDYRHAVDSVLGS